MSVRGGRAGAAACPEVPVRPALSPLLASAAGAWCAVTLATRAVAARSLGQDLAGVDPIALLWAGVVAFALLCLVAALRWRAVRALAVAAALGVVCGCASGLLAGGRTAAAGAALADEQVAACTFVVQSDPRATTYGRWRFEATAVGPGGASARVVVEYVPADEDEVPDLGSVVECSGSWGALDLAGSYDASLFARGVALRVSATRVAVTGFQGGPVGAVRRARAAMLAVLDPRSAPERALVAGVACGDQAALAPFEVYDQFSDLGLSHLVAVSGSHLAVVAGMVGALVGRTRARPGLRLALTAGLLGVYVLFTGVQPSAVRSWVMAVLALAALVAGRRAHAVSAVGAAATGMLLVAPGCAATMGFELSVLSVVGLALFARWAAAWVRCALPRAVPSAAVEPVALTLVSQVSTAPVTLAAFQKLPLLSPLANVLVVPPVTLLLTLGLVTLPLAALFPGASDVLLAPALLLAQAVCLLAGLLSSVPFSAPVVEVEALPVGLACGAAAALVYAFWPRPSRRRMAAIGGALVLVLLALALRWRVFAPTRVVVLDVGQGDAVLVQDGAHAVLVDAGPDDAVAYALARNHVYHLDAVVLTHTDLDHVGGLAYLEGRVSVGCVVVASGVAENLGLKDGLPEAVEAIAGSEVVEVAAGDVLSCGSFTLEVVWPDGPVTGTDNAGSVVLEAWLAGREGAYALLTGDAESAVVDPLLQSGTAKAADVLKVGHHGSAVSTTSTTLALLEPLVAVASAGENNSYGHPTEQCVSTVEGAGVAFHATLACGDVDLRPAADGVEVRCEHHGGT